MESGDREPPASPIGLNPNHARVLATTFAYVAQSLASLEAAIHEPPSPLARFADDLRAEQRAIVVDHLTQLRERLAAAIRTLRLRAPDVVPLTRALSTSLIAAQIALEELAPERLRAYGLLEADAADHIATVVSDLDRTVRRLANLLARPAANDLATRIASLGDDQRSHMLAVIERVASRHGFVELRPAITALLELLENRAFEVAVFGRVSCGKSTLLNAIIGAEFLPVGATPVTAVVTRVRFASDRASYVTYRDGRTARILHSQIRDYVTESGNPGNRLAVASVTLEIATPILESRVTLVDTPGVGSLAIHGVREALAYLPRTDLGVLVLDATTAVSREDTDLLYRFEESGIDAIVVLSKGDLLSPEDRGRVHDYFAAELERTLGRPIQVDVLAARTDNGDAKRWFRERVLMRCGDRDSAVAASAARKLAALHATLVELLRTTAGRAEPRTPDRADEVERVTFAVEHQLRDVEIHATAAINRLSDAAARAIAAAAHDAHAGTAIALGEKLAHAMSTIAAEAGELLTLDLASTRTKLQELVDGIGGEAANIARGTPIRVDLTTQPALSLPSSLTTLALDIPHWPAVERRLTARLDEAVGNDVRVAFDEYVRAMRAWSADAIEQLATQVAIRLEPVRAFARGHRTDPATVADDLATLERL